MTEVELRTILVREISARTGQAASSITDSTHFGDLGLKSLDAVIVSGMLEDHLDVDIEPTIMFENRTLKALLPALMALKVG